MLFTGDQIVIAEDQKDLGVTFWENGRGDKDIMKNLGKGKNLTKILHLILWNNNITKKPWRTIKTCMLK